MTDDYGHDDAERDYVRELFADPPPRDVVPGEGLTREDLVRQNANVGKPFEASTAGSVVLDVDGRPNGVEPSKTERVIFGGACVSLAQLEAVGLTRADVPNLTISDDFGTPEG